MHRKRTLNLFIDFLIAVAAIMFTAWGLSFLPQEIQATTVLMLFAALLAFTLIFFLINRSVPGGQLLGKELTKKDHPRFYWAAFFCHASLLVLCLVLVIITM